MRTYGPSNGNGLSILLVDGDDCLRLLIREYLEASGFAVKDAATASEALRLAGTWGGGDPKLLVTAAHLPDASGAWLAGLLKGRGRPDLAVLYLLFDSLSVETLEGEEQHVQKPFSFLQLHSAVEGALVDKEPDVPGSGALRRFPAPWHGY